MGILRKTKSLQLLLDEFEKDSGAISVINLVERLGSRMNKTTIYRILGKLEQDGIVHSFLGNKGCKWYAKCNHRCSSAGHSDIHPHFQCTVCEKINCLPIPIEIPEVSGFQVENSQILLQGKCAICSSKST